MGKQKVNLRKKKDSLRWYNSHQTELKKSVQGKGTGESAKRII